MSATPIAIAIDGPVASGKSAVGSAVADRLGYRFVDTGVMYRAITWLALERGVGITDEAALTNLASTAQLDVDGPRVVADGADITDALRSPRVGEAVSLVSRVPGVRRAMVALQRTLASAGDIVMVGRDIGTVVLPDAMVKVYLEASVEERVRRRHSELVAASKAASVEDVRRELELRDSVDSSRDVSPLKPARDAIMIQTDNLTLDEVVERVIGFVEC
jgi:cytidylate kinase